MRTVPVFDLDLHLSPHVVVVHGVVERVSQSFQLVVWTAAAPSRCLPHLGGTEWQRTHREHFTN